MTQEWRQTRTDDEFERAVAVMRRKLGKPRVLAFANPKGGVHKTTATVLAAATVGSMGMSPSSELGDNNGFFQAAHGSAPTIAGKDIANPFGTILSAASMLEWLAQRHGDDRLRASARQIAW